MRKGGHSGFSWLKLLVSLLIVASLIGTGIIGYLAFTHQLPPVVGAISFIVIVGFFIWFITVLRKSSIRYRTPSFLLVFLSLVGITLICAFAGVEPLSAYKDKLLGSISSSYQNVSDSIKSNNTSIQPQTMPITLPFSFTTGIYISRDYPKSYLELNDDNTFAKRLVYQDYINYSTGTWQIKGITLTFLTKNVKETYPLLANKQNYPNQYFTEIGLDDWIIEGNQIKDSKGLYWQLK